MDGLAEQREVFAQMVSKAQSGGAAPASGGVKLTQGDDRIKVEINGTTSPAIWDLFGGGSALKWLTIAIFTGIFGKSPTFSSETSMSSKPS